MRRHLVLVASAVVVGLSTSSTDVAAQEATDSSFWTAAATAVRDHLVESGTIAADATLLISHSTIALRRRLRPANGPELRGAVDAIKREGAFDIVRREDVVHCQQHALRTCQADEGIVILSFGDRVIRGESATIEIMAEHNVLDLGLRAALFRVQMFRSGRGWIPNEIQVLGVS